MEKEFTIIENKELAVIDDDVIKVKKEELIREDKESDFNKFDVLMHKNVIHTIIRGFNVF